MTVGTGIAVAAAIFGGCFIVIVVLVVVFAKRINGD